MIYFWGLQARNWMPHKIWEHPKFTMLDKRTNLRTKFDKARFYVSYILLYFCMLHLFMQKKKQIYMLWLNVKCRYIHW